MFLLTCVLCEEDSLMKLTAINNNQIRQKINSDKNNNHKISRNTNKNINFTGFADFATVFWNFVDKGGRGLQFTVEDMLGTNFPRTYQGAMAGYEYTHQINWNYLWQEGIREFLTGPTMTLAPIAILAIITKMSGNSANIHRKNISNLSYLTSKLPKENINEETFRFNLTKTAVEDMLTQTTKRQADEADIKSITEGIIKYGDQARKAKTKFQKKEANKTLEGLGSSFEQIIKSTKENLSNTSFNTVKYSSYGSEIGEANFKNYVKFIDAFTQDYAKKNIDKKGMINLGQEAIENFKNSCRIKRFGTIAAMIFLTGYVMSFIPKLYTLASGGTNPAGKAIYAEAKKREGK